MSAGLSFLFPGSAASQYKIVRNVPNIPKSPVICGRKKAPEFNDHKWNGCKCSVCGLVRNSGHEFHRVKGAKRYGVCFE